MDSHKSCAKCGSSMMQDGFILDHTHHSVNLVAQWQPGKPKKSFWRGVETKDSPRYEIKAYRCKECGYLELYAI